MNISVPKNVGNFFSIRVAVRLRGSVLLLGVKTVICQKCSENLPTAQLQGTEVCALHVGDV